MFLKTNSSQCRRRIGILDKAQYLAHRVRRLQLDLTKHRREICASVFHFAESQKGVSFAEKHCSQTTDVCSFFFLLVIVSQTHFQCEGRHLKWWAGETSHTQSRCARNARKTTGSETKTILIFRWGNLLIFHRRNWTPPRFVIADSFEIGSRR